MIIPLQPTRIVEMQNSAMFMTCAYLALCDKLLLKSSIVDSIFPDNTFAPQHKTDAAITNAHCQYWNQICKHTVNNVVPENPKY